MHAEKIPSVKVPDNKLILQQARVNYVSKIFYVVLFILVTEACLGFYMYKFIIEENNKIREGCLLKGDFEMLFLKTLKSDACRDELTGIFEQLKGNSLLTRFKRESVRIYLCPNIFKKSLNIFQYTLYPPETLVPPGQSGQQRSIFLG